MATARFLLGVAFFTVVHGYMTFQDKIPNGKIVPNPCSPDTVWQGVGHENQGGGGLRNPFGKEFKQNGYTWTQALCMADSDGDGVHNGAELGDPDCTWSEGLDVTFTTGLSHPGICEPLDLAMCQGKNDFLENCASNEFVCDAIHEEGIIQFEARFDETAVPNVETSYFCQSFEFDTTTDYHIVAATPIIDIANVMHHAVLYGCRDEVNVTRFETAQSCFMEEVCSETIFVWAFGGGGTCVHEDAGFRVGANGYKRIILEIHWNNPYEIETYRDSSGMILYMTPNLRTYDAGTMVIGQNILVIPPGKERVSVNGTCTSACSQEMFQGPINIFGALNHMHFLGDAAVSKLWSAQTGEETIIALDEVFDYNAPKYYSFDEPKVVYPGDELTVDCHFKSTSRDKTTFVGYGSSDEMCYTVLMYYPKENEAPVCTSTGSIAECDWTKQVYGGCDKDYILPHTEKAQKVYSDLESNCQTTMCLEECLNVVRELKKNPCFQYPMTYITDLYEIGDFDNVTEQLQGMKLKHMMYSCDAELEREAWMNGNGHGNGNGNGEWPTSGSVSINLGVLVAIASVILVKIM